VNIIRLTAVLASAILAAAWARPSWRENPVSTASAAYGGGGSADRSGVGALFVNPAALDLPGGFQVETGMMGMTEGIAPYAAFGSQARPGTAYALGYFYDARTVGGTAAAATGPARQGLVGGGSWDAARGMPGDDLRSLRLGASAHTFGTEETFGVDADAGARLRAWRRAVFGAAVRNLLESGIGQKPEGYATHRRYLLSLGLEAPTASLWKLRFRDPNAEYEFRAEGYRPSRLVHAFSAGASFIQSGMLGLRGTVLLPQTGVAYFAGGFSLRMPLGNGLLACGYAFTSGSGGAGDSPSNSFSFNFSSYARIDRLAPAVAVKADRLRFVSDSGAAMYFQVSATDRMPRDEDAPSDGKEGGSGDAIGRLRAWSLAICPLGSDGRAAAPARAFQGQDLPPRIIRWDGRNDEGEVVAQGFYAFRMTARDASGNEGATAWQLLEIDSGRKPEPMVATPPSPNDSLDLDAAPAP
jgi:hypothetical protein